MSLRTWWHKIKIPAAEVKWLTAKGRFADLQMGEGSVAMMRAKWDLREAEEELRARRAGAGLNPETGELPLPQNCLTKEK